MTQTYVLFPVISYSTNLANELKKSKKYYIFDIGIRNTLLKDYRPIDIRPDKGILYETAVYLHLAHQIKPNMEVRFWRTKKGDEIDFILLKNRIPIPIEVKSTIKSPTIPKGIRLFLQNYPESPFAIVFNANHQEVITFEDRSIYFKKWSESADLYFLKNVL